MIALFYERGNNIDRIISQPDCISAEGMDLIKTLKDKYKIQSRANDVLTLARVSIMFPVISENQPITFDGPKCLCMQAFASVIPKNANFTEKLISSHGAIMHKLSLTINENYQKIGTSSTILETTSRLA